MPAITRRVAVRGQGRSGSPISTSRSGPSCGITKGDLIQYYADVAPVLLPHIRDRAMVMKRYPHGAAGEFFFMKRAPEPRPAWIRTCRDRPRIGQRHRLSGHRRPAVAALGDQSRLHRPEPVVRALRRRRSAGLPALRSRSRRRRDVDSGPARPRASSATRSTTLKMPSLREDHRLARAARLRADRARAGAERGVDVREGAGASSSRAASRR